MTINRAYNLFLAHSTSDRRYAPETLVKLRDCFKNWILPQLGAIEITAITLQDVTSLNTAMVRAGMSVSRQYAIVMWVKIFLRFCRDYLKASALDPAEIRLPRRPAPDVVYLTRPEVARMVGAIPVHTLSGKRLRALVELLLGTGLRISEALAFPRNPFDTRQPMVAIAGKGGRRRNIHLTDRVFRWVQLYLNARHDQLPQLFVTIGDRPTTWARADISRCFRRLRTDAQITKQLTPHILRHTYCTTLLHNGVDIRFIRDLAGHRDISTTARFYLGVDDNKLQEVVRAKLSYDIVNDTGP